MRTVIHNYDHQILPLAATMTEYRELLRVIGYMSTWGNLPHVMIHISTTDLRVEIAAQYRHDAADHSERALTMVALWDSTTQTFSTHM